MAEAKVGVILTLKNQMKSGVGAAAGDLAKLAAGYMTLRRATQFAAESFDAFAVQESAEASLTAALKQIGINSADTANKLFDLAAQFQNVTKFGDEASIAALTLGTRLLGSADAAAKLLPVVLDMATALQMDLLSAMTLAAKAASGNTSVLTRYGIAVKKGADASETLDNVVKGLRTSFAGAARSIGTAELHTAQLKNSWGDFKEIIGEGLAQDFELIVAPLHFGIEIAGRFVKVWREAFGFYFNVVETLIESFRNIPSIVDVIRGKKSISEIGSEFGDIISGFTTRASESLNTIEGIVSESMMRGMRDGMEDFAIGGPPIKPTIDVPHVAAQLAEAQTIAAKDDGIWDEWRSQLATVMPEVGETAAVAFGAKITRQIPGEFGGRLAAEFAAALDGVDMASVVQGAASGNVAGVIAQAATALGGPMAGAVVTLLDALGRDPDLAITLRESLEQGIIAGIAKFPEFVGELGEQIVPLARSLGAAFAEAAADPNTWMLTGNALLLGFLRGFDDAVLGGKTAEWAKQFGDKAGGAITEKARAFGRGVLRELTALGRIIEDAVRRGIRSAGGVVSGGVGGTAGDILSSLGITPEAAAAAAVGGVGAGVTVQVVQDVGASLGFRRAIDDTGAQAAARTAIGAE